MNAKPPTGPKSTSGKEVASRNATKHGLTAEHPLTQDEDQRLEQLLKALNEEYKPETITEEILVARVANCQLRAERLNKVERAMYEAARRSATDDANIFKKLDLDQTLKQDYANRFLKQGHYPQRELPIDAWRIAHARLLLELQNYGEGGDRTIYYGELKKRCPELHKRICFYCDRYSLSYREFFNQLENQTQKTISELAELLSLDAIEKDVSAPEPMGPSADEIQINRVLIDKLPRLLYHQLSSDMTLPVIEEMINKAREIDSNTAMPSEAEMNQIIRYGTTLNNQLSKAIGELRLVIKERKNEEASLNG